MIHKFLSAKSTVKLMGFWPPYLFAGVSVKEISDDFRYIKVQMKQKFFNTNYVGTHFGGSLYSMTDPWFMFMFMHVLGKNYIVWDKAAEIKFKKPGRGIVTAEFRLDQNDIDKAIRMTNENRKYEPVFNVVVKDSSGVVVSEVVKTLYIRKKS